MSALELLEQVAISLAPLLLLFQALVAFTQIVEHAPQYSIVKGNRLSYSVKNAIKNAVARASLALYALISLFLFAIELTVRNQ